MRNMLLLVPPLLVACAAAPARPVAPDQPVVHGETPGHTCTTEGTDRFIGQTGTRETGSAIKAFTHAAILRWAPPGYMLSMDFRADRVNIWLDDQHKITKVSCG
jgi:hypothetical protein